MLLIRWTINTKYYIADVSVWMSHLHDDFSIGSLPIYDHLTALVMVFDMNDVSLTLSLPIYCYISESLVLIWRDLCMLVVNFLCQTDT